MIRMQIYDKYTKQYHKYVTRKPDNFAAGNDKYTNKMYCYGFLSSIREKKNYPGFF